MTVHICIPARYESSRFPGKPLARLNGKTLLQHTFAAAQKAAALLIEQGEQVRGPTVLTDDFRITDHADFNSIPRMLTQSKHLNGSERCTEYGIAAGVLGVRDNIIINFQGDACLTPPEWVARLVQELRMNHAIQAATIVAPWQGDPGAVYAVTDQEGDALYFSRAVIPSNGTDRLQHYGVYAYRPKALATFFNTTPGPLEIAESLEQLRLLERGIKLRCVLSPPGVRLPLREVNSPEDIRPVAEELRKWA